MTAAKEISAPPSKSLSHRKLIAAALAKGESRLTHVLSSEDTAVTISALQRAGAKITQRAPGEYAVSGMRNSTPDLMGDYAMGESGTSCRLLSAVFAAGKGTCRFHGEPRLCERPMKDLTNALASLGASFSFEKNRGFLPFGLETKGLFQAKNEWLSIRCDVSSQFLSGLLLAAPLASNGLGLLIIGENPVSWPYVTLTLQTLQDSGIAFRVETLQNTTWRECDWRTLKTALPGKTRLRVVSGTYRALSEDAGAIEGDYSGASYFLAAGAIGPHPVTVTNLRRDSLQGDAAILDILAAMGASITWSGNAVTVAPAPLRGITVSMGHCPDLVPTVAVLAAFANGPTTISGVPHLRVKESDRLAAPARELAIAGIATRAGSDGLVVQPRPEAIPEKTFSLSAHGDHRIAMSLALLERGGFSILLDDPGCVAKSFPDFWEKWHTIIPESRLAASAKG